MDISLYRDNDRSSLNCASMLKGGWWWKSCGRGLNGLYLNDPQDLTARQGNISFYVRLVFILFIRQIQQRYSFCYSKVLYGSVGEVGITLWNVPRWWSNQKDQQQLRYREITSFLEEFLLRPWCLLQRTQLVAVTKYMYIHM